MGCCESLDGGLSHGLWGHLALLGLTTLASSFRAYACALKWLHLLIYTMG